MTAMSATDIRDSSKRTADSAGLNEGREGGHRLEKAWRAGQCAGSRRYGRVNDSKDSMAVDEIDDTGVDLDDIEPIFRQPPSLRNFHQPREENELRSRQWGW